MKRLLAPALFSAALFTLAASVQAQLGQSDCSLYRDEQRKSACYSENAAARSRNSTSRARIEQHLPPGSGAEEAAPRPSPQEEAAMRYWHQKALEYQEEQRRWEQSDEYKRIVEKDRADAARRKRGIRQVFDVAPADVRFDPPWRMRLLKWNGYHGLTDNKAFAARVRALFPDIGDIIVEQNRSGYWEDGFFSKRWTKYGRCLGEGQPEVELLGLLTIDQPTRRAAVFAHDCLDMRIYTLQSLSYGENDSALVELGAEDIERFVVGRKAAAAAERAAAQAAP